MVSTPSPPDPAKTAAAQAGLNRETAITQQQLNMVNQQTPYGSLTYSQSGQNFTPSDSGQNYYYNAGTGEYSSSPTYTAGTTTTQSPRGSIGGRNGQEALMRSTTSQTLDPAWSQVKGFMTPSYTATTSLSPQQQAILDQTQGAQLNLSQIANNQSSWLKDYLGQQVDTSGAPALQSGFNTDWSADRQKVEDAILARMAPQQQQDQDALRNQLINAGIRPGSAAWDAEWNRNAQGVNDARLGAVLAGGQEQSRLAGLDQSQAAFGNQARSQYLSELYAARNQPLNEIGALLSGSQVTQPQFQSTPQTNVAGVDYVGLANNEYKAQLASSQAQMGGLFGLLSAPFQMSTGAAGFFASDRRLKRDIACIGTYGRLPVYSYRYLWDAADSPLRHGFMSDDVRLVAPYAVAQHHSGYDVVNYEIAMEAA